MSTSTRVNYYTTLGIPCSEVARVGGEAGRRVAALLSRAAVGSKACEKYSEKRKEHSVAVRKWSSLHVANDRELARLASWESIQRDYRARRGSLPPRERLLVDMYLMHPDCPPKRLDYGRVRVFRGRAPSASEAERHPNHLVLHHDGHRATLILSEYKTARALGTFRQDLPEPLAREVAASLAAEPTREWLVEAPEGGPLGDNRLGKMLSRAMQRLTGMRIGASNLRKSFITHIKSKGAGPEELGRAADLMLHSTTMQRGYEKTNIVDKVSGRIKNVGGRRARNARRARAVAA